MEGQVPGNSRQMGEALVGVESLLRLSTSGTQGDLHHQRGGSTAPRTAQSHQDQRGLHKRKRFGEAAIFDPDP